MEFFLKGNGHYEMGEYEDAVRNYRSLLDTGFESPELWYNLGNAYYKLGRIGYSVLSYERAKKLEPSDESILYNLSAANLLLKDKIIPPPENFLIKGLRNLRDSLKTDSLISTSLRASGSNHPCGDSLPPSLRKVSGSSSGCAA